MYSQRERLFQSRDIACQRRPEAKPFQGILPGPSVGIDRGVIAWTVLVFALLFLGLAPLYILHLDLAKLNASTAGAAPIALVGILFTAYTSDSCRNRAWRSV